MKRSATEPRPSSAGRDRVLEAATALFRARGFVAVSMQEIASAAGMTKAAPYYHFTDKESLLVEVYIRVMTRQRTDVEAIMAGGRPLRDRLVDPAEYLLTSGAADLDRLSGDVAQHVDHPRLADLRGRIAPPHLTVLPAFRDAEGHLRVPPEAAARTFAALLLGHVQLRRMDPGITDGVAPTTIVDVFLRGVGSGETTGQQRA
ncbi:MAG: TetR/AcrR family transcriptional regulator [Dermatophilaceae bacterium]